LQIKEIRTTEDEGFLVLGKSVQKELFLRNEVLQDSSFCLARPIPFLNAVVPSGLAKKPAISQALNKQGAD